MSGAPPIDPALDIELRNDRLSYIEAVADRVRQDTAIPVRSALLDGPVGQTLADHVAERSADLVVMATHGCGSLSRAWLGSVASDLVRHSSAPLLLLLTVAGDARAEYLLLNVIAPIYYIGQPDGFTFPSEVVLEEAAQAYLERIADRIRTRGFAVETRVLRHLQVVRAAKVPVLLHRPRLAAA